MKKQRPQKLLSIVLTMLMMTTMCVSAFAEPVLEQGTEDFDVCEEVSLPSEGAGAATGINVQYHTQQEITAYLQGLDGQSETISYQAEPNLTAPYSAGALSGDTQAAALRYLNACRYIAGIDANVEIKDDYANYAQHASLVNAINNQLSHSPAQPDGMSDELFAVCKKGTGSSNLGAGYSSFRQNVIDGWMADEDSGNIDRVGHRRWVLNPKMGYTGFGKTGRYSAMYAFDTSNSSAAYYGVAWPAQNMPLEFFHNAYPWTVSMGKTVNKDSVTVKLTRTNDGEVWNFSSNAADGYFNVNNDGYGQSGCIIFRPAYIEYSGGDQFLVEITGDNLSVSYTVSFFGGCPHENTELRGAYEADCTHSGYTGDKVCTFCGTTVERGELIPHKGHVQVRQPFVEPTCTKKGQTEGVYCSVCQTVLFQQEPIEAAGHEYVTREADNYRIKYCKVCGEVESKTKIKDDEEKAPAKTSITKISGKKKGFAVTLKKVSGATGYQIQYSTNKNFKNAKKVSVKSTSKTVKGLKAQKTYYVRVRTYKKSGKTLYSFWSKAKKVKTK